MERQSPDVSEPRAPDKPDEDSQADDNSQSRAPDKPDDDSQSDDDREPDDDSQPRPLKMDEFESLFESLFERLLKADDNSQSRAHDKPDDDRGSSSFWSRIYSVITHPFRVVGNLLCLSWRRTSEPVWLDIAEADFASTLSRGRPMRSIEMITTEKPVDIFDPVPPAPPPHNPPI